MIDFLRDHERSAKIPIIILSAKNTSDDYQLAPEIGVPRGARPAR